MTGAPGPKVSVVVPHYGDPRTPVLLVSSLLERARPLRSR